ncbi:MAG: putative rane protein [Myxococcaceae bacterium]|nr:putative rane protein [Myxococcaceae bacterium]
MQTHEAMTTLRLLRWQLSNIVVFMSLSVAVVIAEELTGDVAGVLPDVPVTVLGSAIGIYVSFRTNSAYDRWWEGRKLWGQLVNSSRHFCAQVLAYLSREQRDAARRFVLQQVLYVHALRCELRAEATDTDPDVRRVACEIAIDPMQPTLTTSLLRRQLHDLAQLADQKLLDARRLQTLDQTLATLLDVQGGCERIRNTPLPPNYGHISELLIRTYAVLLPLAIVDDLHWLAIPVSIVVCLAFKLISEVGRVLEDPFTKDWDALPLHALSRTIERNLRDAIGDVSPPAPSPDALGVLL